MSRTCRPLLFLVFLLVLFQLVAIGRSHADNTPQTLTFSQNWSNPLLIITDDDWSGVPGIIGFRGDGLTAGVDTDPQTLLADDSQGVQDVNANLISPDTFATGGVAEFDVVDDVVALQGSGTADAPYLLIHLNTLSFLNIQVAYNLRDIDGSADDAVQQVALHYRVGSSGNFTNLPGGYVADATAGGSATQVTPITVTLPAAAHNRPLVQLRIMTTNAMGNDEWVGIDDLSITGTFASDFPPVVNSHTPLANAIGQAVDVPISVTFDEPVTITDTVQIACTQSGVQDSTPTTSDDLTFSLPHMDFSPNESCVVTLTAVQVTDNDTDDPPDNMEADYTWAFSTGFLIINEIHYDPHLMFGDANGDGTANSTQDEFVEIFNNTDMPLDISGWTLSDAVPLVRHTFPAGTIVRESCGIVIFGGGTPMGDFGDMLVQTAGTLSLNNSGDTITISDGTVNQATATYPDQGNVDQSLTRDPDVTGGFVLHTLATGSGGALFSPGLQVDGTLFVGCEAPTAVTLQTFRVETGNVPGWLVAGGWLLVGMGWWYGRRRSRPS